MQRITNETVMTGSLLRDINWVTLSFNGTLINAGYQRKSTTPALIQMDSLSAVLLQEMTNKSVTVGPFK